MPLAGNIHNHPSLQRHDAHNHILGVGRKSFFSMGNRAESIKFKLMPDLHIRGVQTQRPDLASAAEWMIYLINVCAPTISVAHAPKLLIADERIYTSLQEAAKGL